MDSKKVKYMVLTAFMAAVISILAPISIPMPSPVPSITLATFAVALVSVILPKWYLSAASVFIYMLVGGLGLPVFSNYNAGFSVIIGPTGGYIIGYLFIAAFTGIMAEKSAGIRYNSNDVPFVKNLKKYGLIVAGMIAGTVVCYAIGTIQLAYVLKLSVKAALMAGVIPFIATDLVKIILAAVIGLEIKKRIKNT
jgi:biotin transport system substrate-specific component